MSATIEQGLFANYFARPVAGRPEGAPVVKLDGRTYDVAEYYLEDLADLGQVWLIVDFCVIVPLISCDFTLITIL